MDLKDRMHAARPQMPRPQAPRYQAPRPHARQASGTPVTHAPSYAQQRAEAARRRAEGEPAVAPGAFAPKATRPAYASHRAGAGTGTRAVSAARGAADGLRAAGVSAPRVPRMPNGPSRRTAMVAAGVSVCVLAVLALGFCYMTMWRGIEVTVNGQTVQTRIGTSLDELLTKNNDFGKQPGRLLSVGGNVLDERGGDRATVAVDGKTIAATDFATTEVTEASALTVENGADATEPHTQEEVALAPGIQMGSGGAIQYVQQWGRAGKKTVWHGERSGETVDHETVKAPQDMVVASVNPSPQGGKYVALTFDDGPSKYTQAVLDILKDEGAKATFYNLGSQAAASPDLVRAVVDGGNELASHTNAHQNLPTLDRDSLRGEISSAFNTLEQGAGARPQMIRAPYGAFTATEWARSGDLISCNVLWNIDTLDWKLPGSAAITNEVLNNAYNGAIILMHDGGGNREQDVEALPDIIDGLHKAGYKLVTVGELMRLDGSFPKDVINGTVKMPKDAALPQM